MDIAIGSLVRLEGDHVVGVTQNRSSRSLENQDWFRLAEVLPRLYERQRIERDIRRWFEDREFLLVRTPALGTSPGLEVHLAAIEATVCDETRYLMTSPEYHMKRLLSAGAPRIAYLGPAWRDHERGHQHHTEFTMLEWYRVDAGPEELMADVEDLVAVATGRSRPWTRLTVAESLERFGDPELAGSSDPDVIVRQLVESVEPRLAEMGAVFLTEYPASLASLARLNAANPAVSDRFEAYVDGVELANGFGELTDAVEQRARFEADIAAREALGYPVYPIDERFLDALSSGLPPCAGIALGVDRLVMLALGVGHIDDIVAFPPRLA